jgi:hypothetical protein
MGKLDITVEGNAQDIVRLHDHLSYHVRKITSINWQKGEPMVYPQQEAKFSVTI